MPISEKTFILEQSLKEIHSFAPSFNPKYVTHHPKTRRGNPISIVSISFLLNSNDIWQSIKWKYALCGFRSMDGLELTKSKEREIWDAVFVLNACKMNGRSNFWSSNILFIPLPFLYFICPCNSYKRTDSTHHCWGHLVFLRPLPKIHTSYLKDLLWLKAIFGQAIFEAIEVKGRSMLIFPRNFVIISESLAANLEKITQTSVWQTVAKLWFIWLDWFDWSIFLFALLTRVSLWGTIKKIRTSGPKISMMHWHDIRHATLEWIPTHCGLIEILCMQMKHHP